MKRNQTITKINAEITSKAFITTWNLDACIGISLQCGEVREEFESAQDLLSSMSQHPASLRTLHQNFGVLKTGMCNFTIFQNGLQPFSYYSSFFTCNKSGRGSETREWLVCLIFFFSCQGYPAAVLSIIEKGNALVKWKTRRFRFQRQWKHSDLWIWGWKEEWRGGTKGGSDEDKNSWV